MGGHATEALIEAEGVLAEPRLPSELRADAKVALLQGLTGLRDNRRAGRLAESILAAPEQERSDLVTVALVVRAVMAWDGGRLAEALNLAAEAVRMAGGQQPQGRQCHPHLFLASRLVDLRRFDDARGVIRSAAGHAGPLGLLGWSANPATLHARMSPAAGRLDDAPAEAPADVSKASAPGSRPYGPGAPAILAPVALPRGNVNTAAEHML